MKTDLCQDPLKTETLCKLACYLRFYLFLNLIRFCYIRKFLGWEDPLEGIMATHSSILAWRISMDRGAWWAAELQRVETAEQLSTAQHIYENNIFREKNFSPHHETWASLIAQFVKNLPAMQETPV